MYAVEFSFVSFVCVDSWSCSLLCQTFSRLSFLNMESFRLPIVGRHPVPRLAPSLRWALMTFREFTPSNFFLRLSEFQDGSELRNSKASYIYPSRLALREHFHGPLFLRVCFRFFFQAFSLSRS